MKHIGTMQAKDVTLVTSIIFVMSVVTSSAIGIPSQDDSRKDAAAPTSTQVDNRKDTVPSSAITPQHKQPEEGKSWEQEIRDVAEFLYFIAGVGLLIVASRGTRQIALLKNQVVLLKHDIDSKNMRAAKEQTLFYCQKFAELVLLRRIFVKESESQGLSLYAGTVGNFNVSELDEKCKESVAKKLGLNSSVAALNLLELIAMAFLTGVAEDVSGFKTIGRSFCAVVATHYDIFTIQNSDRAYWQNVIELYKLWSGRIKLAEIDEERRKLEERAKSTSSNPIVPIGFYGPMPRT